MPREYAQTNIAIWQDPDWRQVPFAAQHLYKLLWEHPQLSYCGVTDWRPGKLTGMTSGLSVDLINSLADCLEARHFIVRDLETEEVLLRSWVRWDGLMKQPRLAVSYANAYTAVGSNELRAIIIHELHKLRDRQPDLIGLSNKAVVPMFGLPTLDAKTRATPEDPFAHGFGLAFGYGLGQEFGPSLPQTRPRVSGSVSVPPTPTPTPTPYSNSREAHTAPRERGSRLPDNWSPDPEVREAMKVEFPLVDIDRAHVKFVDYWQAKAGRDAVKLDWNRTWRNWIRSEAERSPASRNLGNGQRPELVPAYEEIPIRKPTW